jgi:hypothetical protein
MIVGSMVSAPQYSRWQDVPAGIVAKLLEQLRVGGQYEPDDFDHCVRRLVKSACSSSERSPASIEGSALAAIIAVELGVRYSADLDPQITLWPIEAVAWNRWKQNAVQ